MAKKKSFKKSKLADSYNKQKPTAPEAAAAPAPAPLSVDLKTALNLALDYAKQGELQKTVAMCVKILQQHPDTPTVLFVLGTTLAKMDEPKRAAAMLSRAVELQPDFPEAYNNLGNALDKLGRFKNACQMYHKATEYRPDFLDAWFNLGSVLKKTHHVNAAIDTFDRVLKMDPNHIFALSECAPLKAGRDYREDAYNYFDRIYRLTNNVAARISRDLLLPVILPVSDDIDSIRAQHEAAIDALLKENITIEDPQRAINRTSFRLAYHGRNNVKLMKKISALYEHVSPHLLYAAPHCQGGYYPKTDKKLRVGFVSKYFYKHSVSISFNGMIEDLAARDTFEVYTICTERVGITDSTFKQLKSAVSGNISVPEDIREAQRILADLKLDILIYTEIGMDQMAYCLAYARLAPIQMVLPGHPETTGIRNMDYFISSVLLEPENAQENYSETLLQLKDLTQAMTYPEVPAHIKSREELGLPADKNIYMCPMKSQKMHPDFDWAMHQILERDPKGVIVLFRDVEPLPDILLERLKKSIPPHLMERVLMMPWAEKDVFMHYLAQADVVIDPFHFGGGTTNYFILAVGTPIVSWPGRGIAGYGVAYCYRRMGMTELLAKDWDNYLDMTVRIGTDKAYRESLKQKILERVHKLFANRAVLQEFVDTLEGLAVKHGVFQQKT